MSQISRQYRLLIATIVALGITTTVWADIFQWEYIDPADPSLGKQQSTLLCPGGAGVNAVPSAFWGDRDLTMAYLIGKDLTGIIADGTNLSNADLSNANLTNSTFYRAMLTAADFTGADVRKASFYRDGSGGTGITASQLYATASYQAHDWTGIDFSGNDLTGWDLTGAEVRGTNFSNYRSLGGGSLFGTGITLPQLYSTSSYQAGDLTGTSFSGNDLAGGNFSGQNLTNVSFYAAKLTGADFTGAQVRGADLRPGQLGTGITSAQLYSTASYQNHDLTGTVLGGNDMTGWNFAGQNLPNAYFPSTRLAGASFNQANLRNAAFPYATLTDADFTDANVQGANFTGVSAYYSRTISAAQLYSTASYQNHDLNGIKLTNNNLSQWDFRGQDLRNADLSEALLVLADFSGAQLQGANLHYATRYSFGSVHLYSTASYQAHDLRDINWTENYMDGWNLAGQNLSNGGFNNAKLTGSDLTGADTRGASYLTLTGATTTNMILPNGHISGLDLAAGGLLAVRDYDGDPKRSYFGTPTPLLPIPITVDQLFAMNAGGTLRMVYEQDAWDSTISFASGIPVTLGGTLELTFAADVNLASQIGRTFHVFDWTGVAPIGAFQVASPYIWNLSNLYTTGEVTLTAVPEPVTLVLLMLAAVVLCLRRGRLA